MAAGKISDQRPAMNNHQLPVTKDRPEYPRTNIVARAVLAWITLYQKTLSPDHGWFKAYYAGACRYQPTCSYYAKEAITRHGFVTGTILALKRIARCHPLGKTGFDPVPRQLSRRLTSR